MSVVLNCDNCGESIIRYPCKVKEHNFCSQQCCVEFRNKTGFYKKENHPSWNGGPLERICKFCGKKFTIRRSSALRGRGKYCSVACRHNAESSIKICEVCGDEFEIKKSHDVNGNGKYCSLECRSIGYQQRGIFKGENNPNYIDGQCYTPEYVRRATHRRRVLVAQNGGDYTLKEWQELCDRYEDHCLACGKDDVLLTVDHVIPVSMGGSNDISNLQPLCQSCNSSKGTKVIDYR